MSTWEPIVDRLRPTPRSVRFRPDRSRQPELLRHSQPSDSRPTLKPYQLKPERGKETLIEPPVEQPPSNPKQIKRIKKKLGKLNKKTRHSKRKHNNLISKQNSIKKKIEELKGPREPEVLHEPEESLIPKSLSDLSIGLRGVIE